MAGSEASIERVVTRFAEDIGLYTRKFTSPGTRDVPDRIYQYGEWVFFLEFKAQGKRPSDGQQEEISAIRRTGGLATWASSVGGAKAMLVMFRKGLFSELHDECRRRNYWES